MAAPATRPGWLQAFVHANPTSRLATSVRSLMAGGAPRDIGLVSLACAILVVVFGTVTIRLPQKTLARAGRHPREGGTDSTARCPDGDSLSAPV